MDAATLREDVERAKRTELDRVGSNKLLVALTDATLDPAAVCSAAADSERAAQETFTAWADDETNGAARTAFEATAAQEDDHYERVLDHLDDFEPDDEPGPMHSYLRGLDDTIPRVAAGLVGRPLVSLQTYLQIISFFVNEADERTADVFRDLREDTRESLQTGLSLLDDLCESEEDWERARGAAEYVVQVAYEDYADALHGMGLDPKNIC